MLWMPSRPSTTLPPYLRMGFSACSAVGARSDGVDGANACVAHSKCAANIRMIPLRSICDSKQPKPGGSPCCRSVSTRSMQTQFCKIRRTSPLYVKMQFFLPIAASTSREPQRCACQGWMPSVSYMPLGHDFCLAPDAAFAGYSSVGRARSRPWKISGAVGRQTVAKREPVKSVPKLAQKSIGSG